MLAVIQPRLQTRHIRIVTGRRSRIGAKTPLILTGRRPLVIEGRLNKFRLGAVFTSLALGSELDGYPLPHTLLPARSCLCDCARCGSACVCPASAIRLDVGPIWRSNFATFGLGQSATNMERSAGHHL